MPILVVHGYAIESNFALQGSVRLSQINCADATSFVAMLGGIFESSPWVAERIRDRRPFDSVEDLHRAMLRAVMESGPDGQLALIRAHPELAGREAAESSLTADSTSEQARLGFTALSRGEIETMRELNRRYREKFGLPCIVALRLHAERASVLAEMERRLAHDGETELRIALEQIGHITRGRLEKLLGEG